MTESVAATRILVGLLEARTGQQLSAGRSWRLESSLKPVMAKRGIGSLDGLCAALALRPDRELSDEVVEALLNNETSFFRDATVFEQLKAEIQARERAGSRPLKIWSAACSTGQEPYSVAMMLRDATVAPTDTNISILGSDVSAAVIARAREGRYSQFEIQRGLPVRAMLRWFTQETPEWVARPELRRTVRFIQHNLIDPAPGGFDIILCRNVMMYFPQSHRRAVFDRLADALEPGGLLMLGAGETVIGQTERFVTHPTLRGVYLNAAEVSGSLSRVASR